MLPVYSVFLHIHAARLWPQELIFTARRVCGSEAVQLGLVDHCVEEGKALERALELAREVAQVRRTEGQQVHGNN